MRRSDRSPSIAPPGADHDVYLVLVGRRASDADLETVITDLLDGQYSNPVCVIGFNTAEG